MTTCNSRSKSFSNPRGHFGGVSRSGLVALVLVLLAAAGIDTTSASEEMHAFVFTGVSENAFNPLEGRFTAQLSRAAIDKADDAVRVFINGRRVADGRVKVRDRSVFVDYVFDDGVNDVLLEAQSIDGAMLRGDALLWAGGNSLVVDVTDAKLSPLEATLTLRLASDTSVLARAQTTSGSARFENLPAADLVLRTMAPGGIHDESPVRGDSGSLLVTVHPPEKKD